MSISSGDKLHVHPPLHPHEKEKVPLFSSSSLLEEKESYHNEKKEGASSIIVQNWKEEEDRINAGSHSKEQDIHQRLQPEQSNAGQNKEDSVPSSAPTSSSTSNFKSQNNSPAVTRIPYPSSLSSLSPSKSHASLLSSENKKANEKESLKNDERVDQRNINDQTSSQSGHSPHNANHPPQTSPQQNKQNPNPKSSGRKPVSAASIVVCGVDGTVYTIDAYTGQLRGLFASGPALVHSSSSADVGKENDDDEAAGKNTGGNNNNEQSADDVENGWEDHSSDNSNNNRNTYDNSKSNALLSNNPGWKERVVPGLDGTLYSLFEVFDGDEMNDGDNYDNMDECQNFDSEEDGYFDDFCHSSSSSNDENGSGDTSSSTIMPRFGTYNLTPLPISVMDVVDSPISTCRPINAIDPVTHEPQQQCGIVVGSKKTTIYAIDPITGKVQWTQDPHGGAGAKGLRSNPKTSSKTRMVLLQREDYAVRHLDTDGGEELWKVELGKFSALDFDVDAHHRRNSDESEKNDFMNGEEDGRGHHNINKRRRGAAAAAASLDNKDKKRGVSPLLGPKRTHSSLRDNDSFFGDTGFFGDDFEQQHDDDRKESLFDEDDIVHDHSQFLGLPSIAFGEDGISIMAVDGMSGEILWKRRIESVVAAVYGVGKESIWIPLDVIDESEIFSHDHHSSSQSNGQQIALLPSSSQSQSALPSNGGLVPYLNGQHKSGQLHRLGRHHTNLFVSSKFDDVSLDSSSWSKPDMDRHDFPYVDELLNLPLRPQINDHGHGFSPSPASTFDVHSPDGPLPPSHASEHGLFLNWQMLYAIIAALLATIIFAGFAYFRQKRKWENTPLLAPASATNSSEDGVGRLRANSNGIILPPAFSTSGDPWWKEAMSVDKLNKPQPYFRSLSLSAIGSPPGANFSRPFVSEKDGTTLPLHELSADAAPTKLQIVTTGNTSPVPSIRANASSPATLSRSKTLPIDSPTCDKAKTQPPLNIDNIDGIPLIRYSRYRSEFTELSPLGKGGFGTVFRCVNTLDSREYAIKKIWIKSQLRLDDFSQKLHRVLREVKILAVLDHPNIVRYYTAWLEVSDDDCTASKNEYDESNTASSFFDSRRSPSVFSNSVFSGFGSNSKGISTVFSPKRSLHQRPATKALYGSYMSKGNPLGWNNFGSFTLDESKSRESSSFEATQESVLPGVCGKNTNVQLPTSIDEDLGFTWERSNEESLEHSKNDEVDQSVDTEKYTSKKTHNEEKLKEEESQSSLSSIDSDESSESSSSQSSSSSKSFSKAAKETNPINSKPTTNTATNTHDDSKVLISEGRHTLFIQMQLCSIRTLGDFLANHRARSGTVSPSSGSMTYAVDVPFALRLFGQIANGVKYVHKQGLIHRDLKPQNCFIDDAGNVKVGDFGLSRESSSADGITAFDEGDNGENGSFCEQNDNSMPGELFNALGSMAENTAGVGTRAYASPEQMRGSNYDASTDVYSLGIILFELCYPMYTAMERYKEFSGIRKGQFPSYWDAHVKTAFPTLHDMLVRMISEKPLERPSAADVSDHIDALLREYSVQSLDKAWGEKGALLLRVEAEEAEGVLASARKLIKDAAPNAKILQYGLRGQASKAIMEFALEIEEGAKNEAVERIGNILRDSNMVVRRINAN